MSRCWILDNSGERHGLEHINGMIPLSHNYPELQAGFLENITQLMNDKARLNSFLSGSYHDIKRLVNNGSFNDQILLWEYFDVFNDMFFYNTLTRGYCPHEYTSQNQSDWIENQASEAPFYGYTIDLRKLLVSSRYSIKSPLRIFECHTIEDNAERMLFYLGVLLHEMIHAFIQIYACFCPQCRVQYGGLEGERGHGETFQAMGHVVQDFTRDRLLLNVDLRIERSISYDSAFSHQESNFDDRSTSVVHRATW